MKIVCLMFLLVPTYVLSQIGLSYPYTLVSENNQFYLKSIPHASQLYDTCGRTEVYSKRSANPIYVIARYFNPDEILLSPDGASILHVKSMSTSDCNSIFYYKNGRVEKCYRSSQIVQEDSTGFYFSIFYVDTSSVSSLRQDRKDKLLAKIEKTPLFASGDRGFVATKDREVVEFDLHSGEIVSRTPFGSSEPIMSKNIKKKKVRELAFDNPGFNELPMLANNKTFETMFAESYNMVYDGVIPDQKYKYYLLQLRCVIDYRGNCLDANAQYEDSSLNTSIRNFILNLKFKKNSVPKVVEKWYFEDVLFLFRKTDTVIAKKERLIELEKQKDEYLWRIEQDTLNGMYIPINMEDCLKSLDRILSKEDKRKMKERDAITFHFGVGTYLRNSWGLWSGSRLQKYFQDLGIRHPDDMSGVILDSYHKYLNGEPVDFQQVLKKYEGYKSIETIKWKK